MIVAIVDLTVRQLLGQRRTLLLAPFAALPVIIAVIYRLGDRDLNPVRFTTVALFNVLIFPLILPLVALIFGTAAVGAEIDEGTAVYLLSKPVPRWKIVLAKLSVAAGAAVAVTGVSAVATVAVTLWDAPSNDGVVLAFPLATALGAAVYTGIFLALSILTTRAFIAGLIYSAIWEGVVTGLFTGTRIFSVRAYTVGIADALSSVDRADFHAYLGGTEAAAMMVVVGVGAVLLAIRALKRYEIGEAG